MNSEEIKNQNMPQQKIVNQKNDSSDITQKIQFGDNFEQESSSQQLNSLNFANNQKNMVKIDFNQEQTDSQNQNSQKVKKTRNKKFTKEEDALLEKYIQLYGKNWKKLSTLIPGKTQPIIRNRYYAKIRLQRKKLEKQKQLQMQNQDSTTKQIQKQIQYETNSDLQLKNMFLNSNTSISHSSIFNSLDEQNEQQNNLEFSRNQQINQNINNYTQKQNESENSFDEEDEEDEDDENISSSYLSPKSQNNVQNQEIFSQNINNHQQNIVENNHQKNNSFLGVDNNFNKQQNNDFQSQINQNEQLNIFSEQKDDTNFDDIDNQQDNLFLENEQINENNNNNHNHFEFDIHKEDQGIEIDFFNQQNDLNIENNLLQMSPRQQQQDFWEEKKQKKQEKFRKIEFLKGQVSKIELMLQSCKDQIYQEINDKIVKQKQQYNQSEQIQQQQQLDQL